MILSKLLPQEEKKVDPTVLRRVFVVTDEPIHNTLREGEVWRREKLKNESRPFSRPSERPNILFILADDLGISDLTCYGSTFYDTPNLDHLASQGIAFRNAYAASPVCSPSRASILTGVLVWCV